jgi:spermidine synthase
MEVIESLKPKKVLLIGGGTLTLPMALLSAYSKIKIDVVEIDPTLQDLAEQYFGFKADKRIRIINEDGRHFLDNSRDSYDLIVIDAFTHTVIPTSLTSLGAIESYASHLERNGSVAINIISSYYGRNAELIQQQYEHYHNLFKTVEIFPASRSLLSFWLPQNFVLVAQLGKRKEVVIRYEALEPPIATPDTKAS